MEGDEVELTNLKNGDKSCKKIRDGSPVKTLSLFSTIVFTVNTIIGSGIFSSVPRTFDAFLTPSIGMVVVFWISGGLVSTIGGLCYAELAGRIPESGGDSAYYSKTFTSKLSLLFSLMFLIVMNSMALAALAHTAGTYIVETIFPGGESLNTAKILVAITTLVLLFSVNCISKTISDKFSIFFTVCKLSALGIIIGCGIYSLCTKVAPEWQAPFDVHEFDASKLCLAVSSVFWACEGWTSLGAVTGEMKNPHKDFLKAIIIGMSIVIVSYVLAIVSYSAVIGYATVRATNTVALDVAKVMLGKYYPIIPVLITASAMGTENGTFFFVSTALVSAGYRNELPKIFSLVHRTKRTGVFSLVLLLLISIAFVFTSFDDLIQYCAFISWTFYFLSFCALEKLKLSPESGTKRNIFHIHFIFIVLMRFVCIFMVGMTFIDNPLPCSILAGVMIIIMGLQFLPERFCKPTRMVKFHDAISKRLQLWFNLVNATTDDVS